MRAEGDEQALRLTQSDNYQQPSGFSSDGRWLAYVDQNPGTDWDIWVLPLDLGDPDRPKPGKPEIFLRTPHREGFATFSHDGRWLAYTSNESGVDEVYVRPFPGPGVRSQISARGGSCPVWARNGKELMYKSREGWLMVAGFTVKGNAFSAQKPLRWSENQIRLASVETGFDLTPDDRRILMLQTPEGKDAQELPTHASFLLHFFDELRRRVPSADR